MLFWLADWMTSLWFLWFLSYK